MSSLSSNCREGTKVAWTPEEDEALRILVKHVGPKHWSLISKSFSGRTAKSCRLRWCNQLAPGVDSRPFTAEEDDMILKAHEVYGNKWAVIARLLVGRTDNAVKNRWNCNLKKRTTHRDSDEAVHMKKYTCEDDDSNSGSEVIDSAEPPQLQLYPFFPLSSNYEKEEKKVVTFFDCGKDDCITEMTLWPSCLEDY
ncbi:transcription factor MYB44-like [Typha angustifolia]|uniref:transcription factor MYB44-like n=1 Tax=Typha angustifolia TaxID=59011 RepID=UPI003C300047